MIEIVNPGWQSLIVDGGRFGRAEVGVPPSSAMDGYAYRALQLLTGNGPDTPVIEVMGPGFALKFHRSMTFAVTGARVGAMLDDRPVRPWASMQATAESVLQISEVLEGFRYYIGFSGMMEIENIMGSFSTNQECRFGGFQGRPLRAKDRLAFSDIFPVGQRKVAQNFIPPMHPPHTLRVVAGPEISFFTDESCRRFMDRDDRAVYDVSTQSNRTGIRLEGEPLAFIPSAPKSIISEGILPGAIQIPGDGRPIIMLHERTIGGYARIALVVKADIDRLAHLRPGDNVLFEHIDSEKAQGLWKEACGRLDSLKDTIAKTQ